MSRMFVHELVTGVCAPAAALSAPDGQVRPFGAHGWLVADVRHLSELTVLVGDEPPHPIGHWQTSAASLTFVGAVLGLGDPIGDPTVRLERGRVVEPADLHETIKLVNDARTEIAATVRVRLATDLAPILAVRHARPTEPVTPETPPDTQADTPTNAPAENAAATPPDMLADTPANADNSADTPANTPAGTPDNADNADNSANTSADTPAGTPADNSADAPTNAPADVPANTPTDTPAHAPTDTQADTPAHAPDTQADVPANVPADTPAHAAANTPAPANAPASTLAVWRAGSCTTTVAVDRVPDRVLPAVDHVLVEWDLRVPARDSATVTLSFHATGATDNPVVAAPSTRDLGRLRVTSREPELDRLVTTGLDDLGALLLADPAAPADRFAGAGTPWYFTLFGRDSLWAARFALPLGTDLALGTLRTLARRQGTRHDRETAEEPGKILHEIRQLPAGLERQPGLPPCYYGTIDATPLWISLLHDAWRWGLPDADVEPLLDPLRRALDWILSHGDGFLSYQDDSGRGLANQGWKDSIDSIQDSAGTVATPPIVLSEAQAYAHRAALDAAALLTTFDRPGAGAALAFAEGLRNRFRESFWANGFPAIALDGANRPMDTLSSNLGHLLGTGLLSTTEESTVASRIAELDSGFGLRTMDQRHPFFNPVGYHTGSVWPHDTAIAIDGLARAGHPGTAAALARGLVRAGTRFDHRLPELYGGWSAEQGPLLAYPAACRPQAWSAASVFVLVRAALGLDADVPAGRLTVSPAAEFADWFPLRVEGLTVAGHDLAVEVDRDGHAEVHTEAQVELDT